MKSKFFPPNHRLSPFINGYVYWDDNVAESREILFTVKGTASLSIPLHDDFTCIVSGKNLKENCLAHKEPVKPVIYGQMTSFGKVRVEGHVQLIFVIFTPLGLHAFLRMDAHSYTDKIIFMKNIEGVHVDELRNFQFKRQASIQTNISLLDQVLLRSFDLNSNTGDHSILIPLVQALLKTHGTISVYKLAEMAGVSTRTLELHFKKFIGLSPKTYCRIVRFNSLIQQLSETPQLDSYEWIEKYGYSDQSHFIKDFKDFTGMSPMKYFKDPSWDDYVLNKSISK